ncbi:hypothetical protein D3C78_1046800 [compost metagenome]
MHAIDERRLLQPTRRVKEHRQRTFVAIEFALAGNQSLQSSVTVTTALRADLAPDTVLRQQANRALWLGEDEKEVALPQLLGKAVIGGHQVRAHRAQA